MREKEVNGSVKRNNAQSRKKVSENKGVNLCWRSDTHNFVFTHIFYETLFSGTSCLLRARSRGVAERK